MPQVRVTVESDASIAVLINTEPVALDANSRGRVEVELGEENLMVWSAVGDPGTDYEITLSVLGNREIKATTGKNPVKSRIPTTRFRGGGFNRFKVVSAEDA